VPEQDDGLAFVQRYLRSTSQPNAPSENSE
jgi:hypothetical protein